jgi:molybdopterin biosynthesis enzyme
MTLELGTKLMVGLAFVVMDTVAVLAHVPLEAVSVYTTLADGVITTLWPLIPPGAHV